MNTDMATRAVKKKVTLKHKKVITEDRKNRSTYKTGMIRYSTQSKIMCMKSLGSYIKCRKLFSLQR
jgi:hypothetical protein